MRVMLCSRVAGSWENRIRHRYCFQLAQGRSRLRGHLQRTPDLIPYPPRVVKDYVA